MRMNSFRISKEFYDEMIEPVINKRERYRILIYDDRYSQKTYKTEKVI